MLNHSFIIFARSLITCILVLIVSNITANDDRDRLSSRINAHFTINDNQAAYQEAHQAIQSFPDSDILFCCYIQASARLGLERKMLAAWDKYAEYYPAQSLNRQLIEEMAWGVLNKAATSSSLVMRQMSLLAALFSQDTKGVKILHRGLEDSNYAIRALAVELSGHLPDAKLVNRIRILFHDEKTWLVRQKIIPAIGTMKIHELKPELKALIASDESLAEEKALAIKAILDLSDCLEREEVFKLAQSNRAGLRLLACEAITYFQSMRDLDLLFMLSKDFNPDVRLAALQAIGLLRPQNEESKVLSIARERTQDANYQVVIAATWLLTLYEPQEGMNGFTSLIHLPQRDRRILAAAALKATGRYGAPLALKLFNTHFDPYVRLNLSIHLAGQRLSNQGVCSMLEEILENDNSKWCKFEVGHFEAIATNRIFKNRESELTTEMEDQLVRLEILNLLAILKSINAQSAIRQFLTERPWQISGAAAILLLTEGDELAIELVCNLLDDPQYKVRLQAALVLSLWSQEESAIEVLEKSYLNSNQEQKCRILEAIARIGSMKSVPFLIEVLHEPSQTLRLVAALGVIQCLNH